jgi:hypothetical protein
MANGRWTHDGTRRTPGVLIGTTRYARGYSSVGASIWQTPGGVVAEIEKANSDFNAFQQEIKEAALAFGYPGHVQPEHQPLVDLYVRAWIPLLQGWATFYKANKGWTDNFWWNHAPEAEQFLDQLIEIRGKAEKLGFHVMSATPTRPSSSLLFDPQHNLVDDTASKAKELADFTAKAAKIALVAGLGLAGVLVIMNASRRSRG